jgi:hypothetical protein
MGSIVADIGPRLREVIIHDYINHVYSKRDMTRVFDVLLSMPNPTSNALNLSGAPLGHTFIRPVMADILRDISLPSKATGIVWLAVRLQGEEHGAVPFSVSRTNGILPPIKQVSRESNAAFSAPGPEDFQEYITVTY